MRVEQARATKGSKAGRMRMGAVMGLALVAGVCLSLVAPKELDTSLSEVGNPEAAGLVFATSDSTLPGEAIVETSSFESGTLDLQLD